MDKVIAKFFWQVSRRGPIPLKPVAVPDVGINFCAESNFLLPGIQLAGLDLVPTLAPEKPY